MEYVKLKNSDLVVSRFCMGGCPMGGYGWGETNEQEFIDAIHLAIKSGINFFDTADTYGLGQSEKTLGKAIKGLREKVVIQSKFGVRIKDGVTFYDNSPEYIEKALDLTLERLGTDYIDIYTIHYRDGKTPLPIVINKLLELREKGKVRYFGLSNVTEEDIPEIEKYKHLFVSCQNEYSLACRKNEQILKKLDNDLNITPTTWGSLGQGVLTGKYNKDTKFQSNDRRSREIYVNFHGEKFLKNLKIVEYLKIVAKNHNKSIASCAIRFILDFFPGSVVLAGVKRPSQLLSNIQSMNWKLTKKEFEILEALSNEN